MTYVSVNEKRKTIENNMRMSYWIKTIALQDMKCVVIKNWIQLQVSMDLTFKWTRLKCMLIAVIRMDRIEKKKNEIKWHCYELINLRLFRRFQAASSTKYYVSVIAYSRHTSHADDVN